MALAAKAQADKAAKIRKRIANIDEAGQTRAEQKIAMMSQSPALTVLDATFGKPEALITAAETYFPRVGEAMDKQRQQRKDKLAEKAEGHDVAANEAAEEAGQHYHATSGENASPER